MERHYLYWAVEVTNTARQVTHNFVDLPRNRDFHISWTGGTMSLHAVTVTVKRTDTVTVTRTDETVLTYQMRRGNAESGVIVNGAKIDIRGELVKGTKSVTLTGRIFYLDPAP